MQLGVREPTLVARFAFPDDRGSITATGLNICVETVVAEIRLATDIPLHFRAFTDKDLIEWLEPVQFVTADLPPKGLGIFLGRLIDFLVLLLRADNGTHGEIGTGRKQSLFSHYMINVSGQFRHGCFLSFGRRIQKPRLTASGCTPLCRKRHLIPGHPFPLFTM
jgi:hypothetical protein